MAARYWFASSLAAVLLVGLIPWSESPACCPAPHSGQPVVNADQTVIIIWDPATKTQHFIRQASFQSQADDFGFLVPTPSQPELEEAGNEAFAYLLKLTEPRKIKAPPAGGSGGMGCGCGASAPLPTGAAPPVRVLEEKLVAGFNAVVLEADSAGALVGWLKEHGYAYSPEIEAWAKPYVDGGWKITALKVAKAADAGQSQRVAASALRMSFKTDRPVFPYREPDSAEFAKTLGATSRLLRIYFLADARYQGDLTKEVPWTGRVAWANPLQAEDRQKTLELLHLPETTGPAEWWLTEFEDNWPYAVAPADLYFAADPNQNRLERLPVYVSAPPSAPTDVLAYALVAVAVWPILVRRQRRGGK